jgi:2-polyprenyl-6-methoxyphenol 4-hydroxylase
MSQYYDYDVIIAGGGMVGASLACALSLALGDDLKVAVVESFPLPTGGDKPIYQPSFDARSTALAAGSRGILKRLGIWSTLSTQLQSINQIHVSNRGRPGSTLMDAGRQELPALGYVVENHWLGRVLLARVLELSNISWLSPATVSSISTSDEGAAVSVIDDCGEKQYRCRLAVIADGANSSLAASVGINYVETDYRHTAIIANVVSSQPHQGVAYERFTQRGPLAMLPLPKLAEQSRSALVWTMPTAAAEQLMAADDSLFLGELQQWFGYRLGKLIQAGARNAYPLKLVEAQEQVRPSLVVVGNAAHFLHPVAGQGFNLALRDIDQLVSHLQRAALDGQPLGSLTVLNEYQGRQFWDQRKTTDFSDRIGPLFMDQHPLLAVPRDLALAAMDVLGPAKSWFIGEAAGLGGRQARW